MHYKNGREAKAGDKVALVVGEFSVVGILHSITPGSESCNARIAVTTPNDPYVTIKDCLHLSDIAKATIPDSTKSS